MSITVRARYEGQQLVLEEPLDLPEGVPVRVTIEPVEEPTIGQEIVARWHESGVIGAWAHRKCSVDSAVWARQLRRTACRRRR